MTVAGCRDRIDLVVGTNNQMVLAKATGLKLAACLVLLRRPRTDLFGPKL